MTALKKWLLIGTGALLAAAGAALFVAAPRMARRFEPMVREQAVQYLRERFHSDVEIAELHIQLPKMSRLQVLFKRERGAKVRVDGAGLSMWFGGARDVPPLFSMRKFSFQVDLQALMEEQKSIDEVSIEGMEIHVPPKGERAKLVASATRPGRPMNVLIQSVQIKDAVLVILPRDKTKNPLRFEFAHTRLKSVGTNSAMDFDALLTIPKPPGQVHSNGSFGPWAADEPGDTAIAGIYSFEKADLGVFNGIDGTLTSTGTFEGSLDAVHARGEAKVPDFRLKMAGNKVPLWTRFEVLVDGTNGNTVLKPVKQDSEAPVSRRTAR